MTNKFKHYWDDKIELVLIGAVAFLLASGVVIYLLGFNFVLRLTPVVMAVMAGIGLLIWQAPAKLKSVVAAAVVAAGFFIEIIGVHSGYVFGDYTYGSILGFKAWGVPIIIGLNWLIVTLSAWHIVSFGKLRTAYKFLLAGAIVVMFDLILEQFAVSYGLWAWQDAQVPLLNYASWFFVSQLFFWLYFSVAKRAVPSIFLASLLPLLSVYFWFMLITV